MANETKRTFQERERLTKQAVARAVRELKAGATMRALRLSGKYTDAQLHRAEKAFEGSSFKKGKQDKTLDCKCGARVFRLNILGECLACEVRRYADSISLGKVAR